TWSFPAASAGALHASRRTSTARLRTRSIVRLQLDRGEPLLADDRPALHRLPRRGVGTAGHRRTRRVRAPLPRGLPVRALVVDDPAQARELPPSLRRL